jgi:putative transcriptional regulator
LAIALTLVALSVAHAADEDPLANGILLVAKPELADPNFRQTVLLITQPVAGGGPLGVVLNRPTEVRLAEARPEAGTGAEQFDYVYAGGPVAMSRILFLVHSEARIENGLRVLDNVYLSADPQLLKTIVAGDLKVKALRTYAGYAGWAPRQLQAEITAGGWYVLPADAETIFSTEAADLWHNLIRKITLRSAQFVPHPRLEIAAIYCSKNSRTLSIQDFARGLCLPESFALMLSSSLSSSR